MRSEAAERARPPVASDVSESGHGGEEGHEPSPPQAGSVPVRPAVALARAALVAAVVLVIDRVTKHLVVTGIAVGSVHSVLPGIHLVHVQNTGVAFSLFAGGGALVLVLTLVALLALIAYFLRRPGRRGLWLATGLLVGGAIGNLIDRLLSGSVTDFIKLPHWPAFNVSDMAITVGVILLVLVLEGPAARRAER